jgi:hypothetical protein
MNLAASRRLARELAVQQEFAQKLMDAATQAFGCSGSSLVLANKGTYMK